MLGAQETIGKISLLRDNVCTDIADDRPTPARLSFIVCIPLIYRIIFSKKPDLLESCLRNHQSRRTRHSRQGQDGDHSRSGEAFGERI